MIAPSLKLKSTEFIFKKALSLNSDLNNDEHLIKMLLSTITLEFKQPEERIIH